MMGAGKSGAYQRATACTHGIRTTVGESSAFADRPLTGATHGILRHV
jgi:hypothetical protein